MESSHTPSGAHVQPFSFHDTSIDVAQNNGDLWVSVRRVCEVLGVAVQTQITKLRQKVWARMVSVPVRDSLGRDQDTAMIHLDSLPMWLATIEPSRVAESARPKLELFQVECAKVLRDHFFGPLKARKAVAVEPAHEVELGDMPTQEAYEAKRQAVTRHMHRTLREASRAVDAAWRIEEDRQTVKLYGSLAKLLDVISDDVSTSHVHSVSSNNAFEVLAEEMGKQRKFRRIVLSYHRERALETSPPVPSTSSAIVSSSYLRCVAALSDKKVTAGELVQKADVDINPKSLGRSLLTDRGSIVAGRRICGEMDPNLKQWVWWAQLVEN